MRKHRDARIVTFLQDYMPDGFNVCGEDFGMPMIKGSRHAMHVRVVEQLQAQGVKMKVEKPDWDKMHTDIKARRNQLVEA